jgi:hypothetical protein
MMETFHMMRHLILGDVRERTRRYSFVITLLVTLFFGYLVITGKWTIRLGDYRGVYNSAWVGSLMGSASTIMLAFFGFYLVKNSIGRDRQTGVGQILAATQLGNMAYVFSKFISNYVVLSILTVLLATAAAVMRAMNIAEGGFNLWALIAPFLFFCLPAMALVAATAVLFESVSWLRGAFGNILYFVIAEIALLSHLLFKNPYLDFAGFGLFIPGMEEAALVAYPGADLGFEIGFLGFIEETAGDAANLFVWNGVDWSFSMVPLRLLWVACAVVIAAAATIRFDRFDPARARIKSSVTLKRKASTHREEPGGCRGHLPSWSGLTAVKFQFNFLRMWLAELRLMLKGRHWAWYLIAVALFAVQLAVPYQYARMYALPAAWIWPLPVWSSMGARETHYHTGQLLFSSAYPLARQFPAMWMAGITVAFLAGCAMLIRSLAAGDADLFAALMIGIVFVPTFALALGTVSGSKKLFEVVYLLMWYIGPVNGLPLLDFVGAVETAAGGWISLVYLILSIALIPIAFAWRRQCLRTG